MGRILGNWRILAATLFSAALVVGAYAAARGIESPSAAHASTETALLHAIASKDSDNDGLPDWEEVLYGTDPQNPDSFHLGMSDGDAVAKGLIVPKAVADVPTATSSPSGFVDPSLPPAPADGTLTAAFAKSFFTLYLAAKQAKGGAALSESDMANISQQALTQLAASVSTAPDFKSAGDLAVSGTGATALNAFAVSAEAVFKANTSNATKSEILYLKDALQNNDSTALAHIASISKAYRAGALGLAALPVPKELAGADLALINAMAKLSEITNDFTRVNTDPMAAMLALQQYPQAVLDFGNAFISIGKVYSTAGIVLQKGAPGASFVNLISDVAASQAAATPQKP